MPFVSSTPAPEAPVDENGDPVFVSPIDFARPSDPACEHPREAVDSYESDPSVGFVGGWVCTLCGERGGPR